MKVDWRFLRIVSILYCCISVGGYVGLRMYAAEEVVRAAVGAAVISFINILLGYVSIEWSFKKGNITFLKIVLGGIGARLFLMAALVLVMIRYFRFDALALTLSLLLFYTLNLGLEIYLLEHKVAVKNQS